MKKIFIILIMIIFLTGCFNYRDINNVIFVTSVLVDVDEKGEPVLYVEAFHAFRSKSANAEKGVRLLFKETGQTLFEAARKLSQSASYKLNYEQNRIIMFTEKAAKSGIEDFLDLFIRDQEMILRASILIYKDSVEKLANFELNQEEYFGLFLNDLLRNTLISNSAEEQKIYNYLNYREIGSGVSILPIISIEEENKQPKVVLEESAIMQNDRMVGILEPEQLQYYNHLKGTVSQGVKVIPHPQLEGKFVTLEILNAKTKDQLTYSQNTIDLKKTITIRFTFGEAQEKIHLQGDVIDKLNKEAASKIQREGLELFKEYKKKSIDIFGIQEAFERKYPHEDIDNALEITNLEVEVNTYIEGSTDIQNFQ